MLSNVTKRATRQSLNINLDYPGNWGQLRQALQWWQPTAILVMGGATPAGLDPRLIELRDLQAEWDGIVIVRLYQEIEHKLTKVISAGKQVDYYIANHLANSGMWVNVGNEQIFADNDEARQFADWYKDFSGSALQAGLNPVIGNFAIGAIPREIIDSGAFDTLLEFVASQSHNRQQVGDNWFSRVAIGSHDYTQAHRAMGEGQPYANLIDLNWLRDRSLWPTKENLQVEWQNNWLFGRHLWLYNRMVEKFGAAMEYEVDVHLTEYGWDTLGDVNRQAPEVWNKINSFVDVPVRQQDGKVIDRHRTAKGLITLLKYFEWIVSELPGVDVWDYVCWQFDHNERVYPDHVRSACHFTWSQHSDKPFYWSSITGLAHPELWPLFKRWKEYRQRFLAEDNDDTPPDTGGGEDEDMPVPHDELKVGFIYRLEFSKPNINHINIRSVAGLKTADGQDSLIGTILRGRMVTVIDNAHIPADGHSWMKVAVSATETTFFTGYIALQPHLEFHEAEQPTPDPDPPAPDEPPPAPPQPPSPDSEYVPIPLPEFHLGDPVNPAEFYDSLAAGYKWLADLHREGVAPGGVVYVKVDRSNSN